MEGVLLERVFLGCTILTPLPYQKQALEETKAVFGPLRERIDAAVEKVEGMLVRSSSFSFFESDFILFCFREGLKGGEGRFCG